MTAPARDKQRRPRRRRQVSVRVYLAGSYCTNLNKLNIQLWFVAEQAGVYSSG